MPHVEPNLATIAVALLGPVCEAHRSCRNPTTQLAGTGVDEPGVAGEPTARVAVGGSLNPRCTLYAQAASMM